MPSVAARCARAALAASSAETPGLVVAAPAVETQESPRQVVASTASPRVSTRGGGWRMESSSLNNSWAVDAARAIVTPITLGTAFTNVNSQKQIHHRNLFALFRARNRAVPRGRPALQSAGVDLAVTAGEDPRRAAPPDPRERRRDPRRPDPSVGDVAQRGERDGRGPP